MALTVTHFYFMKPLALNLPHVGLYGVRAIARQPVGASSEDEMRADILCLAKQLINIATPVANMHAPLGLLEHRTGLAYVVQPAHTFFLLDRHARRINGSL